MSLQNQISDKAFLDFKTFMYEHVGIDFSPEKKTLIASRLNKRLRHYGLTSFSAYFDLMKASPPDGEMQVAIDLLTTNETYFFREIKHFDFLRNTILAQRRGDRPFRVWSAASSSGEEAYSIAMLLDDVLGRRPWEIIGSDISRRVIEKARQGHYVMNRIDGIPKHYLQKYCLKGTGEHAGTLLIDKIIRERVNFFQANLKRKLPDVGLFDVIFLRNVLIYFDLPTKQLIVKQLLEKLVPGGYFFIGHSETLKGINDTVETILPTMFRRT